MSIAVGVMFDGGSVVAADSLSTELMQVVAGAEEQIIEVHDPEVEKIFILGNQLVIAFVGQWEQGESNVPDRVKRTLEATESGDDYPLPAAIEALEGFLRENEGRIELDFLVSGMNGDDPSHIEVWLVGRDGETRQLNMERAFGAWKLGGPEFAGEPENEILNRDLRGISAEEAADFASAVVHAAAEIEHRSDGPKTIGGFVRIAEVDRDGARWSQHPEEGLWAILREGGLLF